MRQARVEQGLTLRAVAEAAGVSPGTVKKIEVGRLVPSIEIFLKVVKALRRRAAIFLRKTTKSTTCGLSGAEADRTPSWKRESRVTAEN